MTEDDIKRINELSQKQRGEGLTEEEKAEQALLRKAYIDAVRKNVRIQLGVIPPEKKKGK